MASSKGVALQACGVGGTHPLMHWKSFGQVDRRAERALKEWRFVIGSRTFWRQEFRFVTNKYTAVLLVREENRISHLL